MAKVRAAQNYLIILVSLLLLIAVITQTTPPSSLSTASLTQLLEFFVPFFAFVTFLANILYKKISKGVIFGLVTTLSLAGKGLGLINLPITGFLIFTAFFLLNFKRKTSKHYTAKDITNIPSLKKLK